MLKRFAAFLLILTYSICLAASAQQHTQVNQQDRSEIIRPAGTQMAGGSLNQSAQSHSVSNGAAPAVQQSQHGQQGGRSTGRGSLLQSQAVPQAGAGLAPT